jgi:hypothetical protein
MEVLFGLTQALAEAVVQGDLDRALNLLDQRGKAFQRIDWSPEAVGGFDKDLIALHEENRKLLGFCQNWRKVLKKRLEGLNAGHLLRHSYSQGVPEKKFVDVRK